MALIGYEKIGHGPERVIVCHGWLGDQTSFNPMRDAMDLEKFTYVTVAYRGYGASKAISGDYTIAEMAGDVIAVADDLGWDKFNIIGHSMGGMVAQRVLADAPERVKKIVAVTPVPASGVPFDEEGRGLFEGAAASVENRKAITDFSTGNRLSKTWIDYLAGYSAETSTVEAFGGYFTAWADTDFHKEIEGNPVPIKVIIGANDPGLNADAMNATYMTWYPNAELEIMENAGHYPMNETPVALATSIEAFLSA